MTQLMMYVLPLMLGRTFDLSRMQVGVDIFPANETANPQMFSSSSAKSTMGLYTNQNEIQKLLLKRGIPKSYSLNVKAGLIKSGAVEAYLREPFSRKEVVEFIFRSTYETVVESLNLDAQPIPTWKEMQGLGTHYVREVSYGGELIVSLRFTCNSTENKNRIELALQSAYGFGREDKYDKNIAQYAESMQIKLFSSVPFQKIPQDMESLQQVLETEFREAVRQQNGGKGVPIMVTLESFNRLDQNWPRFIENGTLFLDYFEEQYDDLRNTKSAMDQWMKTLKEPLPSEFEKKVGDLYKRTLDVMHTYSEVIGSLDLTLGNEQLKPAFEKYGSDFGDSDFYVQYKQLRRELESKS